MPAIAFNVLPTLRASIQVPIIAGGLIKHPEDIEQGLDLGCDAFSMSDLDLCVKKSRSKKK